MASPAILVEAFRKAYGVAGAGIDFTVGGLMVPSEVIPDALATLARLLPATHAMNAFRGLAYADATGFSPFGSLRVLVVGAVLAVALGVRPFEWDGRAEGRRASPVWGVWALAPYVVGALLS